MSAWVIDPREDIAQWLTMPVRQITIDGSDFAPAARAKT
ncbi:hypothetical protein J2X92_005517 [Variovorax paradoxus]|nr:hypothetical protein [Variovorax paradoxus]